MVSRMATGTQDYGYEDNRFENAVSESFHCSICLNVFKEPKMCRNNQHVFCSSCITRHLASSSRCPECNEELTAETLSQVPRVLLNCLAELKIKCDYFSRGCREFVQLGNLSSHERDCGFAPVPCSNQGCGVEINKRDKIYHETEVCDFRKVQCHDCGEIRVGIEELRTNDAELKENQSEVKKQLAEHKASQTQMKINVAELKKNQEVLKKNQEELKVNIKELQDQLHSLKNDFIREVRATIREASKTTMEVPTIQSVLRLNAARKQDIIIAGGEAGPASLTNFVEEFIWVNRTWAQLPPVRKGRLYSSSFVHENQVIVAGGFIGKTNTPEMEAMKVNQKPLQWIMFPVKLPARLCGQGTVVYKNRLIVVGGYNCDEKSVSNGIYEVLLVEPYTTKLLCLMPQPRLMHGTEIVKDKIYIFGGTTMNTALSNHALDSVIVYDIVNNKCESMPPLPYVVFGMSTVRWQNKVIIIGGSNRNSQSLNDVVMYGIVTGESERLSPMKFKRYGCSAVITGDCIVVMGGWNKDQKYLNAVEYYSFSCNSWHELPPMNKRRLFSTAVVKPC